ncbi:MAG: hypothetical protein IKW10_06635 [Oscillospiraceae bacterium]|nr:hypothetical protein [Oscillospiraceae bacterium]
MSSKNVAAAGSTTAPATVYFTFDHIQKKIVGSEYHFKKAGIPDSPQYKALMSAVESQPTYALLSVASKRKVENKRTYAGLNAPLMEKYIAIQPNSEKLQAELEKMNTDKAHFSAKKSWFIDAFPGFDVRRAEAEIREHKLSTYKGIVRKVMPKAKASLEIPKAVNQ